MPKDRRRAACPGPPEVNDRASKEQTIMKIRRTIDDRLFSHLLLRSSWLFLGWIFIGASTTLAQGPGQGAANVPPPGTVNSDVALVERLLAARRDYQLAL